jgi:hypothetical protein
VTFFLLSLAPEQAANNKGADNAKNKNLVSFIVILMNKGEE